MKNEKNTATSNTEMVTISRAEYESLSELKLQNQWLLEQLGLARKRQFGVSSEKMGEEVMDQLSLSLNEAEAYAYGTRSATAEQIAVKAHARKRQSRSAGVYLPAQSGKDTDGRRCRFVSWGASIGAKGGRGLPGGGSEAGTGGGETGSKAPE